MFCRTQVTKESTGKKLLNVVDKIASSNIFQGASEFRPVKKVCFLVFLVVEKVAHRT